MRTQILGINHASQKRNLGIDFLRLVLMFLIILGHLFTHTHIRNNLELFSNKWFLTWGLSSIAFCAVNCFILITGYFSVNVTFAIKPVLKLWLKLLVYALLIGGGMIVWQPAYLNISNVLNMFFPLLRQVWWFMSAYVLLRLIAPFLNKGLLQLTREQFSYLTVLILIIFYILPLFAVFFPPYDLTEGMGIMGFVTLYIIGAYLAVYQVSLSCKWCIAGLLVNNSLILLSKIIFTYMSNTYQLGLGTGLCYHYNTVFELLNAILLFLWFKKFSMFPFRKIITFASSSVLAVYLLHEHPLVRTLIWQSGLLPVLQQSSFWHFALLACTLPLVILIGGVLVDKVVQTTLLGPISRSKFWDRLTGYGQQIDALLSQTESICQHR